MKIFGFLLMSIALGAAIAAYIVAPKTEETKWLMRVIRLAIATIAVTLAVLFYLATASSEVTIKLF